MKWVSNTAFAHCPVCSMILADLHKTANRRCWRTLLIWLNYFDDSSWQSASGASRSTSSTSQSVQTTSEKYCTQDCIRTIPFRPSYNRNWSSTSERTSPPVPNCSWHTQDTDRVIDFKWTWWSYECPISIKYLHLCQPGKKDVFVSLILFGLLNFIKIWYVCCLKKYSWNMQLNESCLRYA